MPVLLGAVEAMYFSPDSSTAPTAPALPMPVAPVLATSHSGLSISPTSMHNVWESSSDSYSSTSEDPSQDPIYWRERERERESTDTDIVAPASAESDPWMVYGAAPAPVAPVVPVATPLVIDYSVTGASLEECFLSQSRMGAALQDEETAGFQAVQDGRQIKVARKAGVEEYGEDDWLQAVTETQPGEDIAVEAEDVAEGEETPGVVTLDAPESEGTDTPTPTGDSAPSAPSAPSLSGIMRDGEVEDTLNIQTKRPRQFVALFKKMFAIDRSQKFGVLGVMVLPLSLLVTAVFILSFLLPWILSKTTAILESYDDDLTMVCDACKQIHAISDLFPLEVADSLLPVWATGMSECEGADDYGISYVCEAVDMVIGNEVQKETVYIGPGTLNNRAFQRGAWLQYYDYSGEHGDIPKQQRTLALLQESLYDDDGVILNEAAQGVILNEAAQGIVDAYHTQWYLSNDEALPWMDTSPLGLIAQLTVEVLERPAMDIATEGVTGQVELYPQFYRKDVDYDRDVNDNKIQYEQTSVKKDYVYGTQYSEDLVFDAMTKVQNKFPFATITIPEEQGIESTVMTPEIQTFLPISFFALGPYNNARREQRWRGELTGDEELDSINGLDAERESLVELGLGDVAELLLSDTTDVVVIPGAPQRNPQFASITMHMVSPINDLMARLATSAYRTATQDRGASINFSFSSFTTEHFKLSMLLSLVDDFVEIAIMLLLGGIAALSIVPYVTHMPVHEREHRIKDMLRINGVSGTQYWGSAFLYLGVVCSIVEALIVLLGRYIFRLSMFRIHGLDLLLAVFVGGAWAQVSFGLFLSNFFKSTQI
ncbi:hypothetical protein KIPB_006727, partial [Kipferlia bialata]|eukprot:g6727.t1